MDTTRFLPAIPGSPKVLALNGGGTAGRASATFLARFEAETGTSCLNDFDLIIGVSTGAVLAAGFGLGKSAEQMADIYAELVPGVFPVYPWWDLVNRYVRGWLDGSHYRQSDLRDQLSKAFGKDTVLGDLEGRVAIGTCRLTPPAGPVYWQSWRRRHAHMNLVDALISSCSAPTYFPPFEYDGSAYIDGAMACNNPSMEGVCIVEELTHQVDTTYVLNVRPTYSPGLSLDEAKRLGSAASWLKILHTTFMQMSDQNSAREVLATVNNCDICEMQIDRPLDYHGPNWLAEMDSVANAAWAEHADSLKGKFTKPTPLG